MFRRRALQIVSLVFLLSILLGNLLAGEKEDAGEGSSAESAPVTNVDDYRESTGVVESGVPYTPEQEYLFDIFKRRRSVRKFKSTPVPEEHIMRILDVARSAPTAGNQQPWKFLVIRDREKLDRLKEESVLATLEYIKKREDFDPTKLNETREEISRMYADYLSAPVYIAVLVDSDSKYPSYNIYDGSLAAGYLMIAARALGYGTVFITDTFPYEIVKKVFDIPDNYERICLTPVGVPEKWPESPEKKPLEEFVVFEKFVQ